MLFQIRENVSRENRSRPKENLDFIIVFRKNIMQGRLKPDFQNHTYEC